MEALSFISFILQHTNMKDGKSINWRGATRSVRLFIEVFEVSDIDPKCDEDDDADHLKKATRSKNLKAP
ncbi:unnamed protein product, partial [Caenorhabditis brenneri]